MNNYDIFEGEELEIADKIQRRRLQILIHSCIYYHFDQNIISDKKYDEIGRDLVKLQNDNPSIAKKVKWSDAFEGFDASTGFDLPITDEWVLNKATRLLEVVSGRKR